jgi:hypothetical protein
MLSTKFRAARLDFGQSAKPTPRSLAPRALLASSLAFALIACTPAATTSSGSGGSSRGGSGGNGNGGTTTNGGSSGKGGTTTNGGTTGNGGTTSNGGNGAGGTSAKGGSAGNGNGGSGSGGSSNGGNGSGGSANGGSAGNGSGGSGNGGAAGNGNGGSANGGAAGNGSGGSANGGVAGNGNGGSGAGGASAGGSSGGANPPGWYSTKDWGVSSVDWHGCVWTGVDCKSSCPAGITAVAGSTTSVTPADFMAAAKEGGPYEVSGSVFNDYNSVALLGFDLNDTPKGDAKQCDNTKRNPAGDGPPAVAMPSGATGIAVNWSAATLPVTFRIQIQGVKGATDATNRWCATIKDSSGPSFVPFTDFSTTCWNTTGAKYNNEPISSVSFLVPGTTTSKSPYDFTVVGFAPGTSKADAPGASVCVVKTGSVGQSALQGDSTKDTDASTQRAVTQGKGCSKKYIVNNNNWGSEASTFQKLTFTDNSFSVDTMNGTGSSAPASFPSLYVGGNGQTLNGTYVTWDDTFPSGKPTAISAIGSAQSTFKWSGKSSGDFNATYDIWFSKSIPTAGSYNDGISGFIMLWLYKPSSRQPIGSVVRSATLAGVDWDVWAGPRGNTSSGTDPAGRPVISYVAKSSTASFSGDLKAFFSDAVSKADTSNGITQTFSSSWYLTDVFAGFEIWSGGSGLKCDEFTVAIK